MVFILLLKCNKELWTTRKKYIGLIYVKLSDSPESVAMSICRNLLEIEEKKKFRKIEDTGNRNYEFKYNQKPINDEKKGQID